MNTARPAFEALTDERVLLRVGAGTAERLRRG